MPSDPASLSLHVILPLETSGNQWALRTQGYCLPSPGRLCRFAASHSGLAIPTVVTASAPLLFAESQKLGSLWAEDQKWDGLPGISKQDFSIPLSTQVGAEAD